MGVSHIAVVAAISLWGLWPFSCSKTSTSTAVKQHAPSPSPSPVVTNSSPAVSAPLNAKDLGELELINLHETHIELGGGTSCSITPKMLDRNSLQLTIALQSRNAVGRTTSFIVTRVFTRPGQPFEVAVGDTDITLTPKMAQE
jgi:hypothetical protein